MEFLQSLNERQRAAVTAPKQPMLILAGPGTGKTRTLVARILFFISHDHIPPHKIIAVTFTNKAKEEMRTRLLEELGDQANDLAIGTFHRYCLDLLREYHHEAGLAKQFAIADETTQLMTLSRASRMQDERSLRTVLNAISSYRLNKDNLNPTFQGAALKWLAPYHKELRKNNLIDFDQIILLTQELFAKHPKIVESQQYRFEAILVDEFQDTDPIQYDIMRALARPHRNIFVVADDDQSIFAWRGANIGNIQRYINDFECREHIIVLDQNYRSAQCIIDLATQLLSKHRLIEKQLQAVTIEETRLLQPERQFCAFVDDEEESQFIIAQIHTLISPTEESPFPPLRYADIAILYPNHAIGEQLETRLLEAKIPCQLVKRQGVFEQEDVRKIILLFKLLQNPDDDIALEQLFELELNNDLIFQQLTSLKAVNRTFKQTLYIAMGQEISGISKSQLRRLITTCFGTISNLISYVENNPQADLEELINIICNLIQPTHSESIHSKSHELRDPLDIPGMPEAVTTIQHTLANGGLVYITGSTPEINSLCYHLLTNTPHTYPFQLLSAQAPVQEDNSLILCLDQHSLETLLTGHPEIPESRYIVVNTNLHQQHDIQQIHSPFSSVVSVFKLLQALTTLNLQKPFSNYVIIDLETTSRDIRTTGIVEIGAVKVQDGEISSKFSTLVNPEKPITQGAYKVHGISDDDVRDKPVFKDLLSEFLAFIGDDMLVAHNGFGFDFPILWRLYREATGEMLTNRRFDTLPLARRLFPGQPASVDALMQRFNIHDVGGRHRALDDTIYLAPIFEGLQEIEQSLNRRTEHEELLELVALGISLETLQKAEGGEQEVEGRAEERLLFQLGARKLLSRFSELPQELQPLFSQYQFEIQQLFEETTASETEEPQQAIQVFNGKEVSIARIKELARVFLADNLHEAIGQFLDHATLYTTQDDIRNVNAVNLFTIHSSKGLEFPVVFISGVEKGNLPSFYSLREEGELRDKKLDEQRRLLYVAMTRAKHKLFVTYVNKRGEYPKKRSQFLIELGVESEEDGV